MVYYTRQPCFTITTHYTIHYGAKTGAKMEKKSLDLDLNKDILIFFRQTFGAGKIISQRVTTSGR